MTDTTPTPADLLRAALDRAADLHERFTGSTCGTCADADGQAAAWPCETASVLAVARQLLGTSAAEGVTPSAERRDRYAAAVACGKRLDFNRMAAYERALFQRQNQDGIDAVMAVADAEQASLRAEAEGLDEALRGAISASEKDGARLRAELAAAAPPAPADRAAVLREAAEAVLDIIGTEARLPQTISGVYRAADHLRALAADAAAPEEQR
ncbi:hypothetical protein [Streptomyces sp. SP18CM02]|uniref:hypothetical protein n=1 Tax=Streptomyces sp. SP18CM02 TaxID=2758571 RepID=UPI00168BD50D|nr:hypothetical protein [Streptomyces sp. SP18CM02]MBD3550845.1 hypothetical protein [Streptomyces sp. SP18CM02]